MPSRVNPLECRVCRADLHGLPRSYFAMRICRECYRVSRQTSVPTARPTVVPRFGIEIENGLTVSAATAALKAAGIRCEEERYNHAVRDYWKVTTDASVFMGSEVVSPPLPYTKESFLLIDFVCKTLRAAGGTVNAKCGLHVHHGVEDFDKDSMVRLVDDWFLHQDEIMRLVPASRTGNFFSKKMPVWLYSSVRGKADAGLGRSKRKSLCAQRDRYCAINFHSYARQGTVEWRAHAGTLDGVKIRNWVLFGKAMVEFAKVPHLSVKHDLEGLLNLLVSNELLERRTKNYLLKRAEELATPRNQVNEAIRPGSLRARRSTLAGGRV